MSWWEFIPSVLAALAILFVPGMLMLLALRAPAGSIVFMAPLISVGSIAVGAVLLGLVDIPFTLGTFAGFHALVTGAAAVIRLVLRRELKSLPRGHAAQIPAATVVAGAIGAAAGALIISLQLIQIMGHPLSISQSYDNIFHLNAIRYISDTGDGSSLTLNSLSTGATGLSFYPAAWHDATALVFSAFPGSVPAATNAMTFAVAAFAWPASLVFLAVTLRPAAPTIAAATGALSSSFVAFPGLMLKWGILYPNLLGYALLPAFLGLIVLWTRAVSRGSLWSVLSTTAALAIGTAALGLAHPNAVTSAAVLSAPLFAWHAWIVFRNGTGRDRILRTRGLTLAIVACIGIWAIVRPPASASTWPEKLPSGQAVGEFVAHAYDGNSIAIIVSVLVLVGVVVALRQRSSRWLVVMWFSTGFLWVVVASLHPGLLRTLITGPWYNDSFRLAALTAIPSVLLAGVGAGALIQKAAAWPRRLPTARFTRTPWAGTAVVIVLAAIVAVTPAARMATKAVAREFEETPDSLLITTDEAAVLAKVDDFVPADGVIAVDPWDGSAVVYALEGRRVTQFHTLGSTLPAYEAIPRALNEADTDPQVCEQIIDGNVRWYLVFDDTLGIGNWARGSFTGFEGVVSSGLVQPVYTAGDVGLYEITGCDG
ncbi:DUF6541 family protein [Microbacterium sp. NPDC090007]|uniref:DUF6541 family protein n=1 Tax=Microbacterium sp. NPDC090007 TaxID=3364204 RepID=UPI0037FB3F01